MLMSILRSFRQNREERRRYNAVLTAIEQLNARDRMNFVSTRHLLGPGVTRQVFGGGWR